MKLSLISFIFVILSSVFSIAEPAQLATNIQIVQNSRQVQIEVNVTGGQLNTLSFNLSNQAKILDLQGFVKIQETNAGYLLKIPFADKASIKYVLDIDQTKTQYLPEELNWYPRVDDAKLGQTFAFSNIVTEEGTQVVHSATGQMQSGVSVVIGKFIKYQSPSGKILIYLQTADDDLAKTLITYLDDYLKSYEMALGPYPYDNFAVVESSDEIGYAFPRMTWIGSQLLRFPFLLKTSLPHELLHSWWGNSVFVSYDLGNWCEGLTVFGADYALLNPSEKTTYRQKALLEYADYVKASDEISLAQFVARGEDRSLQAIGYNKSLMMFVMLEQLVGEDVLHNTLKEFNLAFKFKQASYEDLFTLLKKNTKQDQQLDTFFQTWILGKGAVQLAEVTGQVSVAKNGFLSRFSIPTPEVLKIQGVPLEFLVYFNDGTTRVFKNKVQSDMIFSSLKKPIQFIVDPEFKVFRKVSDLERPITFSKFFGSSQASVVANNDTLATLKTVFSSMNLNSSSLSQIDFSSEGIVLIENYLGGVNQIDAALNEKNIKIDKEQIQIAGQTISLAQNGYFISFKVGQKMVIVFQTNSSLPGKRWFERWTHYGAQGYVALTPTAAAVQGVLNATWIRKFN